MKYIYAYKTSDGTRHEESMEAESREAVFKALREKGIKAIKVVAADGSKANGEIRGVRKRVLAASVIGAAVLAGVLVYSLIPNPQSPIPDPQSQTDFLTSQTRRQVVGDVAVIEKGIKEGWASIFPEEGERFLASFAIPGVPAGQRNTTEAEISAALSRKVEATPEDGIEARQIKAMVEGMKEEARRFTAAGGSIAAYGRKLVRRQEEEIAYYNRAKAEIDAAQKAKMPAAQLNELWEKRNESLRQMGVKLVPMPE